MNVTEIKTKLTEDEIEFIPLEYFYQKHDARVWSLRIDPTGKNLLLFCKVNHTDYNERSFDILYSGGNVLGIHEEYVLDKVYQLLGK
jgi:hypothetical protein